MEFIKLKLISCYTTW